MEDDDRQTPPLPSPLPVEGVSTSSAHPGDILASPPRRDTSPARAMRTPLAGTRTPGATGLLSPLMASTSQEIEIAQKVHEISVISTEFSAAGAKVQQLRATAASSAEEIAQLRAKLKEAEREKLELRTVVNNYKSHLENSEKQYADAKTRIAELKKALDEHRNAKELLLESKDFIADLEQTVKKQRDELALLRIDNTNKEASLHDLQQRYEESESLANHLQQQLQSIHGEHGEVRFKLTELSGKNEHLLHELRVLQSTLQSERDANAMLRAEINATKHTLKEVSTHNADNEADANALFNNNNQLSHDLHACTTELSQARVQLAALKAERNGFDTELARLRSQLESATAEAERASHKLQNVEIRLEISEAENMTMKSQLADMSSQLEVAKHTPLRPATSGKRGSMHSSPFETASDAGATPRTHIDAQLQETIYNLRKQLSALQAERDAAGDCLAAMGPLPAFVYERAAELHHGQSQTRRPEHHNSEESGASVASAHRRRSSLASMSEHSTASNSAQYLEKLRAIRDERPVIIDAVTSMDVHTRALRVERDRLSATVESLRAAQDAQDASTASLKRQLSTLRTELASMNESRDSLHSRVLQLEAELRAKAEELVRVQMSVHEDVDEKSVLRSTVEELRTSLEITRDECESLRMRIKSVESECADEVLRANAMTEKATQMATSQAATQASQIHTLTSRVLALEHDLEASRRDVQSSTFKYSALQSEFERLEAENNSLNSKIMQLEYTLSESEVAQGDAVQKARTAETACARLQLELEEVSAERNALQTRVNTLLQEVSNLRNRIADVEVRGSRVVELEHSITTLKTRITTLESSLTTARTDATAAEQRLTLIKEQTKHDLERSAAATTRLSQELQKLAKAREEDAEKAASAAAAAARAMAALQVDYESVQNEASQLRDRCKSLQLQLQNMANEVQEHRDTGRKWHEEAMQCKADLQAEIERSTAMNRTLVEQLESIKRDFHDFLALCDPEDAGAEQFNAVNRTNSLNASSIDLLDGSTSMQQTSAVDNTATSYIRRSTVSTALGRTFATSIESDIGDLRRRLDTLPQQRSVATGARSHLTTAPLFATPAALGRR